MNTVTVHSYTTNSGKQFNEVYTFNATGTSKPRFKVVIPEGASLVKNYGKTRLAVPKHGNPYDRWSISAYEAVAWSKEGKHGLGLA